MKKCLCVVLCCILVFQFTMVSYAQTTSTPQPIVSITIPLANSEEDVDAMNRLGFDQLPSVNSTTVNSSFFQSTEQNIQLDFTKFNVNGSEIIVSGVCTIYINGMASSYPFADNMLNIVDVSDGTQLYVGVLESVAMQGANELPVLIDLISTLDFTNNVAAVSIGELEQDPIVLFFGTLFPSYEVYVQNYFNRDTCSDLTQDISAIESTSSNTENYTYCGYGTNSYVGSDAGTNPTVILTAAKRDFLDRNGDIGFEVLRVFSRSSAARDAVDGATTALPYAAIMEFECSTPSFLEVDNVFPLESTPYELPHIFNIISTLHGTIAFGQVIIDTILSFYGNISHTFSQTGGSLANNYAKITINVEDSDYATDLPSNTSANNAVGNNQNGTLSMIKYSTMGNDTTVSAVVTVSGRYQYKVYTGTHRIVTMTTGEALLTHTINNREF